MNRFLNEKIDALNQKCCKKQKETVNRPKKNTLTQFSNDFIHEFFSSNQLLALLNFILTSQFLSSLKMKKKNFRSFLKWVTDVKNI